MPSDNASAPQKKRPVLMLIDGHSIVYRAYFVLAPRTPMNLRATGEPTGAVYGFANMLIRAWNDVKPDYWVIAFDRPGPTFRDDVYAEYKAGRPSMPDELSSQFTRVRQLCAAIGMPVLELDRYEADDIIGAVGVQAAKRNIETVVLTGDTDNLQLVDDHVRVRLITGMADTVMYDPAKVQERYGFAPRQMIDFKALKGDSSDNIPGVPGVGETTATKLLQEFGSVEGLYERLDEVTPERIKRLPKNMQQTLKDNEPRVRLNKKLITIDTATPTTLDFAAASLENYDRDRALAFFKEMEFNSMVGRLPGTTTAAETASNEAAVATKTATQANYATVDSEAALDTLVTTLEKAGRFSLDVAATNDLAMSADLVGLAFATGEGQAWYVPLAHFMGTNLDMPVALAKLKPVLEDAKVGKVVHNGKYDTTVLANQGIALRGLEADVTIAAFLLGAKNLTIAGQAFERLGMEVQQPSALLGTGAKQMTMGQTLPDQATAFCCACSDVTLRLWPVYQHGLEKMGVTHYFHDLEMGLLPVLERMERTGIAIDRELLHTMAREMADLVEKIEKAAYESVGHIFKINSPQQLAQLLFEELHLKGSKRTKQGYSTDVQVLEGLRAAHPVIGHVLEYRQVTKLKSTYVDTLPEMINPRTGRVHTTYSQTGAATGRLSSNDPNLQNIPVRTEMGRRIREAFIAQKDWLLLSADYSQIELRILAHITRDAGLVGAFQRDEDIHAATASKVFSVPLNEVTGDQRRFAKVVNFGLLYGMGEFGLATRADISRAEAAPIIEQYFAQFPGIQQYLDDTKRSVREKGYVETLLGRRRYIPEINAANQQIRSAGERMAINAPIQGTAADIMRIGMIRLQERMDKARVTSRMLLQVHDELIFEVPPAEMDEVKTLVLDVLPKAMDMAVPLKVDLKHGRTWGEME